VSRQYKTGRQNRTTYIYYSAAGDRLELTPGRDGVTAADIELLHTLDDAEYDAQRRADARTELYSAYCAGE